MLDLADLDVLERDETLPRAVLPEEPRHRTGAIDRHPLRVQDFPAELREAQIVTDVSVRQQDRVGKAAE